MKRKIKFGTVTIVLRLCRMFLREELKNKNTINNFLENIFSDIKHFSSYKKLGDNYKINVEKNQFQTPKRHSVENNDKTQGNEIIIIQNKYEVLIDLDGSDINGCNNNDNNHM